VSLLLPSRSTRGRSRTHCRPPPGTRPSKNPSATGTCSASYAIRPDEAVRILVATGTLAGALAGLLTSVAAYFLLEPVVDAATALEGVGDGPVSREKQKTLGMRGGFVLIGRTSAYLLAVALGVAVVKRQDPRLVVLVTASAVWREAFPQPSELGGFDDPTGRSCPRGRPRPGVFYG
jgi:hypothetical protein